MDLEKNTIDLLRDRKQPLDVRLEAAYAAGDLTETDDGLAGALVSVLRDPSEPEDLRAAAAIALGPVLEICDCEGFEDDGISEPPISEETFQTIRNVLREVHDDAADSKLVRRRALEAAVRAPAEWQAEAVRTAYASRDHEWTLTAIFAMQYVPGFDRDILASFEDPNLEIRFESLRAAGAREVAAAWPHVKKLLVPPSENRDLLLVAIEAAPGVAGEKAKPILLDLADSEDEEIAEAALDALSYFPEPDDAEEEEEEG